MVRYYFIVMTLPKHKRIIDYSQVIQVLKNQRHSESVASAQFYLRSKL